jgi:hypothetical protein
VLLLLNACNGCGYEASMVVTRGNRNTRSHTSLLAGDAGRVNSTGLITRADTRASMRFHGVIRSLEIAFPEVECNFVKSTLLPLFSFREPEHLTLGIMQRTLTAKIFLAADFNEPVHELHSFVKPIRASTIAEGVLRVLCVLSRPDR